MNTLKFAMAIFSISVLATSCVSQNGHGNGASTPIDSTNVNGTAPATYGGNNPANDSNTSAINATNMNDTGTKANNIHNAGTYSSNSDDSLKTRK